MRLNLDAGWLHVNILFGPDEEEWGQSQADSVVEVADPEPDPGAELDGRRIGFQGLRPV